MGDQNELLASYCPMFDPVKCAAHTLTLQLLVIQIIIHHWGLLTHTRQAWSSSRSPHCSLSGRSLKTDTHTSKISYQSNNSTYVKYGLLISYNSDVNSSVNKKMYCRHKMFKSQGYCLLDSYGCILQCIVVCKIHI